MDGQGNVYLTGATASLDFPTVTAPQSSIGGDTDAFVAKLSLDGSALVYSTYLGGSDRDDGHNIAVDLSGSAYISGRTDSSDFPTVNAFQSSPGGNTDAFVTKLSADGTTLIYSTYLGGSGLDIAEGGEMAVDVLGNAYVAGQTGSADFPTQNAVQPNYVGGFRYAFVTKLDPDGTGLVFSTFLGGSDFDFANGVAADTLGNAYLTGETTSNNFPTHNPFQAGYGGGFRDLFVAKVSATGSTLVFSTYLGGNSEDRGEAIAVGADHCVYVAGFTDSPDFPTENPLQATLEGGLDGFVTKLDQTGAGLAFSSFLGGSNNDFSLGIDTDSHGNIYVAGATGSTDFPTTNAIQSTYGGGTSTYSLQRYGRPSQCFVSRHTSVAALAIGHLAWVLTPQEALM